ncbi:MAG: hypothetical protein RL885_03910 [Planctomycetota bacterium]
MDLRNALEEIEEIRRRLSRAVVFRGYRALPTALSGVLALAAAIVQSLFLEDPASHVERWTTLWIVTAAFAFAIAASPLAIELFAKPRSLRRSQTGQALEQLLPALVAGAVLTTAVLRFSPEAASLLPGLWQILFALAIFASGHLLPKEVGFVALFYLVTGSLALGLASTEHSFSPWTMGLPFFSGQLAAGLILYFRLERNVVQEEA